MEYSVYFKKWMTLEDLQNLVKHCISFKKSYISIKDSVQNKLMDFSVIEIFNNIISGPLWK